MLIYPLRNIIFSVAYKHEIESLRSSSRILCEQMIKKNKRFGIIRMLIESIPKELCDICSGLNTLLDTFIMPKEDELES